MDKKTDIKNIDQQLINWRKQFNKEIPERVGLAFYTNDTGGVEIEVYMTDESMWMSQQIMAELFGVEEHTITYHIQEIYKSRELEEDPTTRKIRVIQDRKYENDFEKMIKNVEKKEISKPSKSKK